MWQCTKCRESIEDSFDVCWNCGTSREGVEDPSFQKAEDAEVAPAEERSEEAPNVSEQGSTSLVTSCPNCFGTELYSRRISSGSGEGIYLLPGLGRFLHYAEFDVVLCAGCGLTRLFAEPDARQNARSNADWKRL
jgi:hypothetical protein